MTSSFSELTSTRSTDVPEAMEQEAQFLTALEAATHVKVQDRTLMIPDSAYTVLMRLTEALEGSGRSTQEDTTR